MPTIKPTPFRTNSKAMPKSVSKSYTNACNKKYNHQHICRFCKSRIWHYFSIGGLKCVLCGSWHAEYKELIRRVKL